MPQNASIVRDVTSALFPETVEHPYGQCHHCGERIPAERLRALPSATLCTPCEQQD